MKYFVPIVKLQFRSPDSAFGFGARTQRGIYKNQNQTFVFSLLFTVGSTGVTVQPTQSSLSNIITKFIVGCRGVVPLGGLVLGYPEELPLRLSLVSLFYSLRVPLKLKIFALGD